MNENLNLVKILKDCPKGTKLYSPMYGDVTLVGVYENERHPIRINTIHNMEDSFTSGGRYHYEYENAECMLFPSEIQRDWSKFRAPDVRKLNLKEFQPFDKVLVRDNGTKWRVNFFSHIREEKTKSGM